MLQVQKASCFGTAAVLLTVVWTTSTVALAQPAQSLRYPWDMGDRNCTEPTERFRAGCEIQNWMTFGLTSERIQILYGNDHYVLLDRAMGELVATNRRFTDGWTPAAAVGSAFTAAHRIPVAYSFEKERLARWRNAVPNSYFVIYAEASLAYANAWSARGQGHAASVSKESWELFRIRLQETEDLLLSAPQALKNTPIWHYLLLTTVLNNPRASGDPDAVFQEAVKRWPTYFAFYQLRVAMLTPKWGGSWDAVESFVDQWSGRMPESEGRSLYARLYISLGEQGYEPGEMAMNWAKMKGSLDDLVPRYPDELRFRNMRASYACYARDKEAFAAAIKGMNQYAIRPHEWLDGHSYDACMRWAAV